jgi:GT2 family glycosyltransferase
MDLSIVIVNWNTRELLRDCLRSVFPGLGPLKAEVLVVDNASDDGSSIMVRREFPEVRLIENDRNLGFAAGNNVAAKGEGAARDAAEHRHAGPWRCPATGGGLARRAPGRSACSVPAS